MVRSPLPLAAVLALLAAAPAAAAPAPMACRGNAFADDPAGDAQTNVVMTTAPGSHDLRSGFFVVADDGRLTANLKVADLTTDLAPQATALSLVAYFTAGGTERYVAAITDGATWSYEYGHTSGSTRVKDGDTTGTPYGGADDVMEIVVPASLGLAGQTLTAPRGETIATYPLGGDFVSDRGPDSGPGTSFEVAVCPPPPPPPEPPAPPPPPPPPAEPEPQAAIPTTLIPIVPVKPAAPYTVTVPRLRARLLRKGRTFSVVIDPGQAVTGLTVTLSKGRKVLAKGRLASLTKKATVRLKVAPKRIPRGTYKLTISGRTKAGRTAAGAVAVDVV